jgi:hypothetical protein
MVTGNYSLVQVHCWDESDEAFTFVLQEALPRLWEHSVCAGASLIITDGDPHKISAVRVASWTTFINATRKRCYWHLVHQEFLKLFGCGDTDSDNKQSYLGVV